VPFNQKSENAEIARIYLSFIVFEEKISDKKMQSKFAVKIMKQTYFAELEKDLFIPH
jgi:hypothetical protein